jgi:hypothetical protein
MCSNVYCTVTLTVPEMPCICLEVKFATIKRSPTRLALKVSVR